MKPLRIDIELAQPMAVPDQPLHFDALMCWAAERRAFLCEPAPAIPLEVHEEGGATCYKASQLFFEMGEGGVKFQGMMTRKYELVRWSMLKDQLWTARRDGISDGSGPQKAFLLFDSYMMPESLGFYCVGDPDGIQDLMQEIKGLGRRSRNGWGKIRSFEITQIDKAECHWQRRALPKALKSIATDGHHPAHGNASYPYWDRNRWTEILEYSHPVAV